MTKQKEWKWDYEIKFKILSSAEIFNFVGRKITDRLMEVENKKTGFYRLLEESIVKEGFLNPILITAGWNHQIDAPAHQQFIRDNLPVNMQTNDNKILMCDRNGGSRLFFAQKHNMKVPCIVSDFCNRFEDSKILYNKEDISGCFKYPPKHIKFDSRGLLILIPHKIT